MGSSIRGNRSITAVLLLVLFGLFLGIACTGPAGPAGVQGPQGAAGEQGPQGIAGPQGPAGVAAQASAAISNQQSQQSEETENENENSAYGKPTIWGDQPAYGISFSSPNGIAIDSSDNVYVTEFRGNRVQKFSFDGVLVRRWGSEGSEDGQFQNPTGIAIDGEGNVYISESGNHRVQKFDSDGNWITS